MIVRTASGDVRGVAENGVTVFRGVPYAEPPDGPLRFAAPRPAEAWDGVRDAGRFGPPPPQPTSPFSGLPGWTPEEGMDCLTVNVWTPGGGGLPVLVWLYGGAYVVGHSGQPEYDGARLAADGAVVVTLNYRLGVQGFGAVPGAPANRGLLDQVAGLRWVADNIAAFGGDPSNVTVFGESAGAGSIAALLAMPSARGLFRRAIAQSVPGTFFSPALADRVARAIAGRLEVPLVEAPIEDVLRATGEATGAMMGDHETWGPIAYTPTMFSPVVDGEVLPETPWEALRSGAARDVQVIAGFTRDEYRMFVHDPVSEEALATAMRVLGPPDAGASYRAAYPDASAFDLYVTLISDWLFRMPTASLADAHAEGGGTVHLYELCWAPGPLGAHHGLDVPLTFGNLAATDVPGASEEAEALSEQFRSAWLSFARTGDPGWPAYTPDTPVTHVFDAKPGEVDAPEPASRRIWDGHGFPPLP